MIDIASHIIEQNESRPGDAPEGYYLDDLGYYVENGIRESKVRMAEYVLFRILKLHRNLYLSDGELFCGHTPVTCDQATILMLADSPNISVNGAQAAWIYNRLKDISPEVDSSRIKVSPNLVWDFEKGDLIGMTDIVTVKDNYDPRKRFQEKLSAEAEEGGEADGDSTV